MYHDFTREIDIDKFSFDFYDIYHQIVLAKIHENQCAQGSWIILQAEVGNRIKLYNNSRWWFRMFMNLAGLAGTISLLISFMKIVKGFLDT